MRPCHAHAADESVAMGNLVGKEESRASGVKSGRKHIRKASSQISTSTEPLQVDFESFAGDPYHNLTNSPAAVKSAKLRRGSGSFVALVERGSYAARGNSQWGFDEEDVWTAEKNFDRNDAGGSKSSVVQDEGPLEDLESSGGLRTEEEEEDEEADEDTIPMVFRWEGGARNVYITGTFNKWREKIPMRRSGNDFLYIRDLKRGWHAYKFIVDDTWRFAPDQPTVADPQGHINNFVDLTNFEDTIDTSSSILTMQEKMTADSLYSSELPDPNDPSWYAKEPPSLPPQLRHIILNSQQEDDCMATKSMQVPQSVTLNHLYCSAIKENLMVLGVTQRYREKFCTMLLYSPTFSSHAHRPA